MPPSDVGRIMLLIAKDMNQIGGFTYAAITQLPVGTGMTVEYQSGYPFHKQDQVNEHLNKAYRLLEREGYFEPSPGTHGDDVVLEGEQLATDMAG